MKTHEANLNSLKSLRPAFGEMKITEIDAGQIEDYFRRRLKDRRCVRRKSGVVELGPLKAATVHQEFRVLAANAQCRREKEILSDESVRRSRVSGHLERAVPSALHDMV